MLQSWFTLREPCNEADNRTPSYERRSDCSTLRYGRSPGLPASASMLFTLTTALPVAAMRDIYSDSSMS